MGSGCGFGCSQSTLSLCRGAKPTLQRVTWGCAVSWGLHGVEFHGKKRTKSTQALLNSPPPLPATRRLEGGGWSLRKVRVSYGEMSEMLCWISIPPSQKTNQSVSLFFTHRGALVSPEKLPPPALPDTKAKAPAAIPRENAEENENICNILFQIALKRLLGGISVRSVSVLRVRGTVFSACTPSLGHCGC